MKNLIKTALLLVVAVAMCACSGGNTPSAVAEKAMKCIIDEDYEGYVDLIYMNEKAEMDKEKLDEQKKQYAAMLKEKMTKSAEKRGKKMKSAKAQSEEISENGEKATVTMLVKYDNDTEETDDIKLRKDKTGNWRIDAGK